MKTFSLVVLAVLAFTEVNGQEARGRTEKIQVSVGAETTKGAITMADLGVAKVPRYHALIIGVSEYTNSGPKLSDLDKPAKDAQRLYDVLTKKYSFDPQDVHLLKNPTHQELSDVLLGLSDKVGPDENLLIFYAGHGYYDKEREFGYWIPSDAKMESRANWISNTTIRDNIGSVKQAKHILLITDACFGGSIFRGGRGAYEANLIYKFRESYKYRSRKGITSGNLTEVPDQSVFIEQVISRLDENLDPYITAFGLFNKIYEPVTNNGMANPQYGVIQGVGDDGGGDFIFIRR